MPRPKDDYIFFWKPTQKHGWAGQWYNSPFTDPDTHVHFPTAENYMMYHKAMLFKDPEIADQILTSTDPSQVKKLGQAVKGFDEQTWKAHRSDIVTRGNLLKFAQNEDLRALLLATGDKILVEASPYDKIWGIGKTEANAMANKGSWGLNLLGEALMQVREELRATTDVQPEQEGGQGGAGPQ